MGMILHSLFNNIGYFIKPAVIHFLHGMQDTSLYRLQDIFKWQVLADPISHKTHSLETSFHITTERRYHQASLYLVPEYYHSFIFNIFRPQAF